MRCSGDSSWSVILDGYATSVLDIGIRIHDNNIAESNTRDDFDSCRTLQPERNRDNSHDVIFTETQSRPLSRISDSTGTVRTSVL
jgi:hypothetical protein